MLLLVEAIVFVLIGLLAGFGSLALWPQYFPSARALTIGTGLVSALFSGLVTRAALGDVDPVQTVVITAICTGLLTSLLARPDLATRHGSHRRRRHRAV